MITFPVVLSAIKIEKTVLNLRETP